MFCKQIVLSLSTVKSKNSTNDNNVFQVDPCSNGGNVRDGVLHRLDQKKIQVITRHFFRPFLRIGVVDGIIVYTTFVHQFHP